VESSAAINDSRPEICSVGIGVDTRLIAPPVVRGPERIAAEPLRTSIAVMRSTVGK